MTVLTGHRLLLPASSEVSREATQSRTKPKTRADNFRERRKSRRDHVALYALLVEIGQVDRENWLRIVLRR